MVVFLPRKPDGLADLEHSLSGRKLALWLEKIDGAAPKDVEVILPKFKLESGYDLVAPCQEMGMKLAFQPGKANFEGMGWKKGDLWISQIKHKAFVEVNEQGTEAAASTAVEMQTRSILRHPVFRADHPFLFLIRDNKTRTILFMGRLANPEE
jgi:serpin B